MTTTHAVTASAPKLLPPLALGQACRTAALEVLNDGPRWGSVDLALWMMGSFARLTVQVSGNDRGAVAVERVEPRMLGRVIGVARIGVLEALDAGANADGAPDWVARCIASGFVDRVLDADGRLRFVPTARPRRLVDCVLSLLAVDYLVRPSDYRGLFSCARCSRIEIGTHVCRAAFCARSEASSLVVPRLETGPSMRPEGA